MATYEGAGVNISEGRRAVDLIKPLVETTFPFLDGRVLSGVGGFCAIVERPDGTVIGVTVDGVGTKPMIASLMGKLDTIGIDLVAMNVNDLAVACIRPQLFCNYIAMRRQVPERTATLVSGMVQGCGQAQTVLISGEMAEMPGLYCGDDFDLAGFAVGFVDSEEELVTGEDIKPGMKVFGFKSNGIHANGLSLVRDIFNIDPRVPAVAKHNLYVHHPYLGRTLGEELLRTTRIYVELIRKLCAEYDIAGFAHITGGGLVDNPPRVLPDGCAMVIRLGSWPVPPIFDLIQEKGDVPQGQMLHTLNMGIGLVAVTHADLTGFEEECFLIGEIVEGDEKIVHFV